MRAPWNLPSRARRAILLAAIALWLAALIGSLLLTTIGA